MSEFRERVMALVPDGIRFVVETWYLPYAEDYAGGATSQVRRYGKRGVVQAAVQGYREHKGALPDTLDGVMRYAGLGWGIDSEGIRVRIFTPKEWAAYEHEQLRRKAEPLAMEICRLYDVKPDTFRFIVAAKKHYRRIMERERHFRDDGEAKMERWACCLHGGAGSEGFFSDNNYASSKIAEAQESLDTLMRYLHRYCPLLMARYQERRAKRGSDAQE